MNEEKFKNSIKDSELKEGEGIAVSEINNQILFSNNLSTNSSVVYTGTNNCFLRCGSLDQIAELVSNANAKKSISLESEIESLAFSRKSSYSLVLKNLIDSSTSFCLISNSCLDNLDLSKHSSSCLLNSDLINSGAMNSDFIEENKYAETESGFIIENNELLSKTNFILNHCKYSLFSLGESFENNFSLISGETSLSNCLNLSFFALLPSSTDHLVSSCSSLDLSLSFNANNCMFFINCSRILAKAILNSSLNSDGISTFTDISAITEINNNELYKSFGERSNVTNSDGGRIFLGVSDNGGLAGGLKDIINLIKSKEGITGWYYVK